MELLLNVSDLSLEPLHAPGEEESLANVRRLLWLDPDRNPWQRDLAGKLRNVSRAYEELGDLERALPATEELLGVLEALENSSTEQPGWVHQLPKAIPARIRDLESRLHDPPKE